MMSKDQFEKNVHVKQFLTFYSKDLSRADELGKLQNFTDIAPDLAKIRDMLKNCIDLVLSYENLSQYRDILTSSIGEYVSIVERLSNFRHGEDHIYRGMIETARRYISSIYSNEDKGHLLLTYSAIKVSSADPNGDISNIKKDYEKAMEDVKSLSDQVKNYSTHKMVEIREKAFSDLLKGHKRRAFWWFLAVLASFIAFCVTAYNIYATQFVDITLAQTTYFKISIIIKAFKNVLLLSLSVTALKICLTKYNAERNLQIIYAHRTDAIKLYEYFNEILKGDSKNTFIIELARIMFNDPQTGYLSNSEVKEINFGPASSISDKLVS